MADLYKTVDVAALDFVPRANDGSGNNAHGGQALDTYDRVTPASYPAGSDGSVWDAPTADGPNAISAEVMSTEAEVPSGFGTNELFQFFGRLITHDVASAEGPARGDPAAEQVSFTGDAFGSFDRDLFRFVDGVRAPIDLQTSFLDLSQVYGANDALAGLLREEDLGRLVAGPGDVLPKLADIAAAHPSLDADAIGGILRANGFGAGGAYIGGDLRLNQQSGLTSGQTLFMLNHNWHADQIAALHPDVGGPGLDDGPRHERGRVAARGLRRVRGQARRSGRAQPLRGLPGQRRPEHHQRMDLGRLPLRARRGEQRHGPAQRGRQPLPQRLAGRQLRRELRRDRR